MQPEHQPLSFGLVDGRPVFVDIADDTYFALEPEEELTFLQKMGESGPPEPVVCQLPTRSALSGLRAFARPSLAEIFAVGKLVLQSRNAIRRQPIAEILAETLSIRPRDGSSAAAADTAATAIRFAMARRFVPIGGNCLSDSLALVRWLASRGESAALVFGVKLDPFAAHCWVQSGGILLNDHLGRIERFTPVRIVQCTPATH